MRFIGLEEKDTPLYPDLGAGVAKYRRKANELGSITALERAERHAYADAIEKAIRAKHRTLHMRPTPTTAAPKIELTPISRLFKLAKPIKMQGDPDWSSDCHCRRSQICYCDHWGSREQAVYAAMMKCKRA